nr:hypothetical protein BCU42_18545 [Vibrio splendidus]
MKFKNTLTYLCLALTISGCANPTANMNTTEKNCYNKANNWLRYQKSLTNKPTNFGVASNSQDMMNNGIKGMSNSLNNMELNKHLTAQANQMYSQCVRGY